MTDRSSTTGDLPSQPYNPRSVWAKRAGMAVLGLVVLAAAVGLLGPREGHTSKEVAGYTLSVDYPAITRAGQPAPLRIRVHNAEGFSEPVTLELSRELFDELDFQSWYPSPSAELAEPERIVYEFDPPEGAELEVRLDARTSPGFGAIGDESVTLLVADAPMVGVEFTVWRMP